MSSDVEIRTASPEDAPEIARVLREAFTPFEKFYTPEAFAATALAPAEIRARFEEKGAIWVALKDRRVVATVSAVPEKGGEERQQKKPRRLYMRSMAVSPEAQGSGVGLRLLRTVEEFAVENEFEKLFLYTCPCLTGAIRLYEQNGFEGGELRTDDFFDTPWFEMEKNLDRGAAAGAREL